jgi:cytochrome c biogenesis protein CcmG/thiol:disulfide interchange protein DsbE
LTELPNDTHLLGRLPTIAPIVVFVAIGVVLAAGLTLNPREIPSPLIGKPVPQFALPPVQGRTLGLASADLRGEVSLVNVFASWCVACKEEHPVFMQLKREAFLPVHGINYKDRPADAAKWLDDLGDPYTRTGADLDGRVSIDWGVYGVPETFIVDREGRIAHKHIGPVTPELFEKTLRPLIEKLRR